MTINRREAIIGGAAAAAALKLGAPAKAAAADEKLPWIDAHVHVWTPDLARYPLSINYQRQDMQPPSFTPEQLMAHARPNGVGRVVLIQMSYYGEDNSYMLDVIRDHPGVYAGVAIIEETKYAPFTMDKLKPLGVTGYRIRSQGKQPDQWLEGDAMQAMWRHAAKINVAMCHLINPEYLPSVDRMCDKFPDTPVVIDHFARIGIDGTVREADLANLCRLARHKHVSVKVSAFYALGKKQAPYTDLLPMIRRLLDAFGPERLMWASDCPFQVVDGHQYAPSINLIKEKLSDLSVIDRQWLLRKSAEQTFFS